MKPTIAALGALLFLLTGCIENDNQVSLYLLPDGAVDVVWVLDNVHSSQAGAEGRKEETKWLTEVRAGKDPVQERLRKSGAQNIEARLLRDSAPYVAIIRGHYRDTASFGGLFELNAGKESGTLKLEKDKTLQKLVFHFPPEGNPGKPETKAEKEKGEDESLVVKLIPVGGKIADAEYCRVASDRRSCRLEVERISPKGKPLEFTVSWKRE